MLEQIDATVRQLCGDETIKFLAHIGGGQYIFVTSSRKRVVFRTFYVPYHHLGFVRTGNSAIRSDVPENPTLEPNMEWIERPVAKIWPFEMLVASGCTVRHFLYPMSVIIPLLMITHSLLDTKISESSLIQAVFVYIAVFVENFVAMATRIARGRNCLTSFDSPTPKTFTSRKHLNDNFHTSWFIANFNPNFVAMATKVGHCNWHYSIASPWK